MVNFLAEHWADFLIGYFGALMCYVVIKMSAFARRPWVEECAEEKCHWSIQATTQGAVTRGLEYHQKWTHPK